MYKMVWSGLLALLLLSGCGFDGTPTRSGTDFLPLTSIEITAASPTIAPGTSTLLTAKGFYQGQAIPKDITDQVVWSSASPAVAEFKFSTAPNKNRVTGIAPGTANLTATVRGISATYALTVSSATITPPLTISPAAPTVPNGLATQFTVTGTFSDSTTQDLTFDAVWASSDTTVATVSNDPASKGLAKAVAAAGTAIIKATFDGVDGIAELNAAPAVVQSISVTAVNTSVLSISTLKNNFTAKGSFSDGTTDVDITSKVAWTSSNTNIATITTTGDSVTTLAEGNTSITATLDGISAAKNLKVTGGSLNSFTVTPGGLFTLVKGTARQLTVIGTFDNGAQRDITGEVVWSSAADSLATVTKAGGNLAWLNALAATPGTPNTVTATVTAGSGSKTATISLEVIDPELQSIAISPTTFPALISDTSMPFAVTATFAGGTTQNVTASSTWSSSDVTIAKVGDSGLAKGRVTGVTPGSTATISATFRNLTPPVTALVPVTAGILQNLTTSDIPALFRGKQVNFTATANYTNSTSKDVTVDTVWSSDNTNVAIFPDSTNSPGQMVAVDSGTTTVKAAFGGLTKTFTITVP
jgi:hypothetical protein